MTLPALASRAVLWMACLICLVGCSKKEQQLTDVGDPTPPPQASNESDWPPPPPAAGTGANTGWSDGDTGTPATGFGETTPEFEVTSLADVHFEFDRYALDSGARTTLADNARMLESYPEVAVVVEGHCDERGSIEYNLALGEKRAQVVRDYLVRYGIEADRIDTVSFGEERPLDPRGTEEAWAANRRAHFRAR